MFCTNCGKEISDSSNFCKYCGTKVSREAASVESSVGQADSTKVKGTRMVRVVFQRQKKSVLWNTTYIVYVDDKNVTFLRNGESQEVIIPEGTHEVKIHGKALIGGKRPASLVTTTKEIIKVFDFHANRTYVDLSSKVGWVNAAVIGDISAEDNSENASVTQKELDTTKVTVKIKDSEFMQSRLERVRKGYSDDTFVGITIDGKNFELVKNLENTELEVPKGQRRVLIVNPFYNKVCEEKIINFSDKNLTIYLELLPRTFEKSAYTYECRISTIEDENGNVLYAGNWQN